ncbi:topology modulation protein [Corynebacterium ciconiae DSM 44920]|uniref:AAA family ATPase n=1 Tax=Corynebacterium ciconiae TaxID=227319 RepID=UPI00036626EA|nr:AAA family ATPase [Corynebacterium ciconiae]WKD61688.1 topology modulation protein [Corynebacterium ciconiae DSM 44920]
MQATKEQIRHAQRILFFGVSGAGKSTTARQLAQARGVPLIDGDSEIGFVPAADAPWTTRDEQDQKEIARSLLAGDRWVLDSAWGAWREHALDRAEIVVCLDYSRARTFAQLLRRTVRRACHRTTVCNGNQESWRQSFFSRQSILVWHLQTFSRKRGHMRAWEADPTGPAVVRVGNLRELRAALSLATQWSESAD